MGRKQTEVTKQKISQAKIGVPIHSKEYKQKLRKRMLGNKLPKNPPKGPGHYNWQGDYVGYWGIHKWINRLLGQPKHCANCGTITAKQYDWANLSHSYKRELSDWVRLCRSCHIAYDKGLLILNH